ncbi:MAG: TonB-dependent receptor, partial [Acidobacteria bacterium]|nr:TonB-dependent receptor [Acidobacteriota bacterium]
FPTKYFPESGVAEAGAYVQAEFLLGRVTLVPGLRFDRFTLDADQQDPIYLAGLNPEAVDFGDAALSPKVGAAVRMSDTLTVHGQYAAGFRAPPYSAINTGFTSLRTGYTTLPNPDLRAERSDNLELGVRAAFDRASVGATVFSNWYDGFIEITTLGENPATRLLEFRSENLEAARISGLELRAEAWLSASVTLRGSYARIEGVEIVQGAATAAIAESTPLGSVAPNEGVIGLRYARPSGRWGQELSVRLVESAAGRHADDWFEPDGYAVVDLVGFLRLAESLTFRFGVLNLTDAKYFEWWNVRGRRGNDPVIDRYSSPGLGVIGSVGYDW